MPLDLKSLVRRRLGENYALHHSFLNRTLVQVQRTIGFDRVYARGEGAYLFDREGRDYLDFLSGFGVFSIGRNHPVVKQAIRDVLDMDLPNMVQMDCALLAGLLAERLADRFAQQGSPHLDAVFLCNSGAEAVEGALKFARGSTGRPRIVALHNSYHGLTYGALSATGNPYFHQGFGPFLPGISHVALGDLDRLEDELRQRDVAALLIEPVQGKGVKFPHDDFFPRAQALCREFETLLICDEVQTGLGRTGRWFAFEHWNLQPDIVTLAKTLSGGLVPCAAVVTRRDIYQRVFNRLDRCIVHSSTFGRNNLAAACGLAALSVIEDEDLVTNAARQGAALESGLLEIQKRHPVIADVRIKGLMGAIEFAPPPSLWQRVHWHAIHALDSSLYPQLAVTPLLTRHRILTQVAANKADVVKFLPPLVIGPREVDRFLNAITDVVSRLTRFPGPLLEMGANFLRASGPISVQTSPSPASV